MQQAKKQSYSDFMAEMRAYSRRMGIKRAQQEFANFEDDE